MVNMKTSIVLPCYNERENIDKIINKLFDLHIESLEIVVVDDNSPDGTAEVVEKLNQNHPIHLIKRPQKLGLGSAYIDGFKLAINHGADYIFEMDADLSHDPEDIPRFLDAIKNADLVIGSRKIKGGKIIGWGWIRKFMSSGAMWFSRLLLSLKAKDVTAGFRCYKRKVLETINLDTIHSNGYAFQEELLYRTEKNNFVVKEIPVTFIDRRAGKSKLSKKDILEFFWIIIKMKIKK